MIISAIYMGLPPVLVGHEGLLCLCPYTGRACDCAPLAVKETPHKAVCEPDGIMVTSSQQHSFYMNCIYHVTLKPDSYCL